MKKNRLFSILLFSIFSTACLAQDGSGIDMADGMRAEGKIYVVVAVMLIIFTGLAVYLFMIDRKVGKLEKAIQDKNK